MSKKKNHFESGDGSVRIEHEEPAVTLADYVSIDKAQAFLYRYDPAPSEALADEVWNETKIREFFTAYVEKTHGDPLPLYLDELRKLGHNLRVAASGELALFLQYRRQSADNDAIRMMLDGSDGSDNDSEGQ